MAELFFTLSARYDPCGSKLTGDPKGRWLIPSITTILTPTP